MVVMKSMFVIISLYLKHHHCMIKVFLLPVCPGELSIIKSGLQLLLKLALSIKTIYIRNGYEVVTYVIKYPTIAIIGYIKML